MVEEQTLEGVVRKFKLLNPETGNIKSAEHKIELSDNKPVYKKLYSVPYKYY